MTAGVLFRVEAAAVFAVLAALGFRAGFGGATGSCRAPSERGNSSYQEP